MAQPLKNAAFLPRAGRSWKAVAKGTSAMAAGCGGGEGREEEGQVADQAAFREGFCARAAARSRAWKTRRFPTMRSGLLEEGSPPSPLSGGAAAHDEAGMSIPPGHTSRQRPQPTHRVWMSSASFISWNQAVRIVPMPPV